MLTLQICAVSFALLGALLTRKPGRWMPYGFVAWLVSNPLTMVFMALAGNWWFVALHLVFFVLALEGTWHWLVRPVLEQIEERFHVDIE